MSDSGSHGWSAGFSFLKKEQHMERMRLVVAGLAVVAATLGTGVCEAAAAGAPARAAVSSVAQVPSDVERGTYWTRGGCIEAGQEGIERGLWSRYTCANGPLWWTLYTDR
jgi:hypothetical protein